MPWWSALTTLDRFFETGLALVHEIVTAPNLANDDFNRIRNLRLERLKQMKDHAGAIAERAFARVLYGSHPYGHLSLGSEPALTSMTVDATRALHAAMFTPAGIDADRRRRSRRRRTARHGRDDVRSVARDGVAR